MSSQANISRPYAQALFELAKESDQLDQWQQQLDLLVAVTGDADFIKMTDSPRVTVAQLQQLVIDVCGSQLSEQAANLVKLVIRNGRLGALSDIVATYAVLKAQAEQVVAAKMVTAVAIDEQHQKRFIDALKTKFDKSVTIEFDVDEALLGGAVISTGDWVIDGSVRAQLEQMRGALG